jgi:hypothetical protein
VKHLLLPGRIRSPNVRSSANLRPPQQADPTTSLKLVAAAFMAPVTLAGALHGLGILKFTSADALAQQDEKSQELRLRNDQLMSINERLRDQIDLLKQRALETQLASASAEMKLSRAQDEASHTREIFSLERSRLESVSAATKTEATQLQAQLFSESKAKALAEQRLVAELELRKQLETSFPALEGQGLWQSGQPGPRALLLAESVDEVTELEFFFGKDSESPIRKAAAVQALADRRKAKTECIALETEKHTLANSLIGGQMSSVARFERVEIAERRVKNCLELLETSHSVLSYLVGIRLDSPSVETIPAEFDDIPDLPEPSQSRLKRAWDALFNGKPPASEPRGIAP